MSDLYRFEQLDAFLTEIGIPQIEIRTGFRIVRVDLTQEEDQGKIDYRDDGIYLLDEFELKGYMYLKAADIHKYGYPKAHIVECETIKNQKNRRQFEGRYFWTNAPVVDITDRVNNEVHSEVELGICGYCRRAINDAPVNTRDFNEKLGEDALIPGSDNGKIEVDIFGYTFDWQRISRTYRKKQNYSCEECRIIMKNAAHYRYIHVHHKNGNKTDNRPLNLRALCILCHACQDESHLENLTSNRMQRELKSFLEVYDIETRTNPCRKKLNH